MAAKGKKGSILSIVINNEYFKICEISKSGKNIVVHKTVTAPTPDNCYNDGVIRDRGALGKAVKVALDEHNLTSTEVVFSIASSKIATKDVEIPDVKDRQIQGIVNANASEYFPVNINEYIIQYVVLGRYTVDDAKKLKIRVMAAPSDMIGIYFDLASSLGLKVNAIDYVGNSSSQLLAKQITSANSVVIQVENDSTIVNIYSGGILEIQRIIPYGKSLVINTVMSKRKIKYDAALKLVQEEELIHPTFDGDEITESVRYLVSNINRIIDFFTSRNQGKLIERTYITGNAASIKGLIPLLDNELKFKLEEIVEFKDVVIDKKTYIVAKDINAYVLNIGAIIKPVNFIPEEFSKASAQKDYSKNIKTLFVGALIASAVLIIVPAAELVGTKGLLENVNRSNDSMKEVERIVDEYYLSKDMNTDLQNYAALTTSTSDKLDLFIEELEKNMPSDVSITNLTINEGVINITGTASSKGTISAFTTYLRRFKSIGKVNVGSESEVNEDGKITATFSMTCTVADAIDEVETQAQTEKAQSATTQETQAASENAEATSAASEASSASTEAESTKAAN